MVVGILPLGSRAMTSDRRNPHIPLDRALIRGFLDGRDITSTELLPSGKTNTSYNSYIYRISSVRYSWINTVWVRSNKYSYNFSSLTNPI